MRAHRLWNRGLGQIIVHPVIARVDIDSPGGRRFVEIVYLKRTEGLDLLIGGQLIAVPAPAERADERDRGSQQFGLDLHRLDARRQRGDLRVNKLKAGSQTALIELHGQVLRFERGPDGGVLPVGREGQPVGQAQIVLDFAEGVEHRRPVSIFRLTIGRPGLLQLGAAIPALEDRQRNGGAIGPETIGEREQIEGAIFEPASEPERDIGIKGGACNADGAVRLRHPALHAGDVGPPLKQSGWNGLRNREIRHAKVVDRFDLETGRRHIEEDGDRLFRHLALALNLSYFVSVLNSKGFDAGDVERRRDLADELGVDEVQRLLVEIDRLLIDRILRVEAAQREIVRRDFRLQAEAREPIVGGALFGAVDLNARRIAERRPEIGLPGREPPCDNARLLERNVGGQKQMIRRTALLSEASNPKPMRGMYCDRAFIITSRAWTNRSAAACRSGLAAMACSSSLFRIGSL